MKKNNILIIATLLGLLSISCKRELNDIASTAKSASLKAAPALSGFHISGARLLDANGNDFVMRGINYEHTTKGAAYPYAIPAIAATGANTIRIVTTCGTSIQELNSLIAMCERYKLVIVFENHDITAGKATTTTLTDVVNHWIALKSCFINKPHEIIINIANEYQVSAYSSEYNAAIDALRSAGITNTLMIDASTGKDLNSIYNQGSAIIAHDPNTMFSIHVYNPIGTTTAIQAMMTQMKTLQFPFCIGEFSWTTNNPTTDDIDEATLMSMCNDSKIGWLAWSWHAGTNVATSFMNLDNSDNWDGSAKQQPWYDVVVTGPNGISTTSTICSVYHTLYEKPTNIQNYGPLQIDINAAPDYAVYAKNSSIIGDGVKLFNNDATLYSSLGGGDPEKAGSQEGQMSLGVWVCAHNIVSGYNSGVELRAPGSQLSGDIISRGPIKGNPIVDATKNVTFPGTLYPNLGDDFTGYMTLKNYDRTKFLTNAKNPYMFNAANSITDLAPIKPGIYGEFNIGSRNNVHFTAGTYYFSKFIVQPDVDLYFPDEKVIIFVKGDVSIQSRVRMVTPLGSNIWGANPANILMVSGAIKFYSYNPWVIIEESVTIYPQVNWRGTLIAPENEVYVGSNTEGNTDGTPSLTPNKFKYRKCHADGEIYGAIYGRNIAIHQRTSVYHVPFDWVGLAPF